MKKTDMGLEGAVILRHHIRFTQSDGDGQDAFLIAAQYSGALRPEEPDTPELPGDPPHISDPPQKKTGKRPKKVYPHGRLFAALSSVVPVAGDRAFEMLRKFVFLGALLSLIGSISYITNESVVIPQQNKEIEKQINMLYNPGKNSEMTPSQKAIAEQDGIDFSMAALYEKNRDTGGFFIYHSKGSKFLEIDHVVLQGKDNDYYLTHDFNRNYNKYGTLFFDYQTPIKTAQPPEMTIIYGHSYSAGQMFSELNYFIGTGKYNQTTGLDYIRKAPVMRMQTIYSSGEIAYKVFAVVVADVDEIRSGGFNYLVKSFADKADKQSYLDQIRMRSVYNFDSVGVAVDDSILMLSTCSFKNKTGCKDSRLAVFARRVRPGESEDVDTGGITFNADVLMPKSWYTYQNLALPAYYGDAE